MKNRSLLVSLLLVVALIVAACNGDEEDDDEIEDTDNGDTSGTLTDGPDYTVSVSGEVEFTLDPENAEYTYDYEEPSTAAGADNMIESVNFGRYTMYFTGDDAEVIVNFSDAFEEGTHTVAANIREDDVVDPDPTRFISAVVAVDGQDYINVQDGMITIENFSDDRITGMFNFTLGDGADEITLDGDFQTLELPSLPNEALDNVEEIEPEG